MSGLDGERGRNRTFNLLIKSQLLCQLSYAPFISGIKEGLPEEDCNSVTHGGVLSGHGHATANDSGAGPQPH
jgi:hypothetical protein